MHTLTNDRLTVSVLDPISDARRLGPRYCAGGYIWQVQTPGGFEFFSGPEFPDEPSVINGQGTPEVFQHTLFDDPEAVPDARLIIGAGLVENSAGKRNRESHWDSRVVDPCRWSVERTPPTTTMETSQQHQGWSLSLVRSVALDGDRVTSASRLTNTGTKALPFRWFAHPFFPFAEDLRLHIENLRAIPANPAFIQEHGALRLLQEYDWPEGYFLDLPDHSGHRFAAISEIPGHSRVEIAGSFPLLKLAVWANDRTCSPEPFHGGVLPPGESAEWSLSYTFRSLP